MNIDGLDDIDKQILAEVDLDCQISSKELAELIGKSRQTVEYRIKQLTEREIITGFHAAINPHRMGIRLYKLYLKLRNIPDEKTRLLECLRSSGNVYWMGECSGSWDVICALYSRSDYDFFIQKNSLLSEFNKIMVDEAGGILIDVLQFPKMWLTDELHEPVTFAGEIVQNQLDNFELDILKELIKDARTPVSTLAGKLESTAPTVRARINKLEQLGVIIQYRVAVDLTKLGLQLYKAIIRFEKFSEEEESHFRRYLSQLPNLQYFIRDMWQYELEFVVLDFNHYSHIIDQIRHEFPYLIRSIDTVLMLTDEWTPGAENLLKGAGKT